MQHAPVRVLSARLQGRRLAQLDIDLVLIKKALYALTHHPKNQKFPLVLVAVNFATLQNEAAATTYLRFLASNWRQHLRSYHGSSGSS
jgi:hypothetical protein